MTNRKRTAGHDWAERPVSEWNVSHFHRYLIDENERRFGAVYVPFGRGSVGSRWMTEKGQIKQAQGAHGNAVLKRFMERCLDAHRPSDDFPHINFGFMYAYKRDEMPRAQSDVARADARAARRADTVELTSDELDELL